MSENMPTCLRCQGRKEIARWYFDDAGNAKAGFFPCPDCHPEDTDPTP